MSDEYPPEDESEARAEPEGEAEGEIETEDEAEEESHFGFALDAFIPLVILSVSMIVMLGWQVSESSSARTQIENAITHQEESVADAQRIESGVSKLVSDLLVAAQTDDAARAIVNKYQIHQNVPAPSPGP